MPNVGVFIGLRGCEGPQPSRSGNAIEALILVWRASGPSAPWWTMGALFGRDEVCGECRGLYWAPRLQGTAALQVNNGHQSLIGTWRASGPSAPWWAMGICVFELASQTTDHARVVDLIPL
jgi:hypothetical protein